jgi:hypothetical protein
MRTFDMFAYFVGGPVIVWSAYHWVRDLRFYKQHNWNWDLDSGGRKMKWGEDGFGPEMSAWERVHFGYPLFILVWLVMVLAALFQVPEG